MPRELYRKLIDKQGNEYAICFPSDVNASDITDILVGIHERLVKLQGFKLAGDVWRLPDSVECEDRGRSFNFHKKVMVFEEWPEFGQNDFGAAVQELIDNAKNYRINRMEIKTFEGKPVAKDNRGYYLQREFPCAGKECNQVIRGRQRLSLRDGIISRAQSFEPEDAGSTRVRPGSKSWFCSSCAPKSLTAEEAGIKEPAQPAEVIVEQVTQVEAPKIVSEPSKPERIPVVASESDEDLRELLKLAGPTSDVSNEFLKGMVYGVLKARFKR